MAPQRTMVTSTKSSVTRWATLCWPSLCPLPCACCSSGEPPGSRTDMSTCARHCRTPSSEASKLYISISDNFQIRLLRSRQMLIFSVTLFYTGLHQVLWSGVYTTSIGFTQAFGEDKKKIAALCGIFFGAGEVLGGHKCNCQTIFYQTSF